MHQIHLKLVATMATVGAAAAMVTAVAGADAAAPKRWGTFLLVDQPAAGFTIDAKAYSSSLSDVRLQVERGMEISRTDRSRSRHVADYELWVGRTPYFGRLFLPSRRLAGMVTLAYRPSNLGDVRSRKISARIVPGSRPAVTLSGLPGGTTEIQLSATANGIVKTTGCAHHRLDYDGRLTIGLTSGARKPGLASGTFVCGD